MLDPLPMLTIAIAIAALFAASLVQKLRALPEWPGIVRNYRLVPDALAGAVGVLLLCAEGLTAAALLWIPVRSVGGGAAAALLALYAAAIGINLARGRTQIDCGCFGSRLGQGIGAWMVWRNGLLALLALALLLPVSPRALSVAELLVALAAMITLGFLYPVLAVVARPAPPTFEQNFRASAAAGARRWS